MKQREEPAGLILLIEDNRGIAEMVGEYLERRGYGIDYATDGLTGLRLATNNSYDVIVLDLMLPGMDGIDLCRRLPQTLAQFVAHLCVEIEQPERKQHRQSETDLQPPGEDRPPEWARLAIATTRAARSFRCAGGAGFASSHELGNQSEE